MIEPNQMYNVTVSADNYFGTEVNVSTVGMDPGTLSYFFQLYSLNVGTRIELNNIYYDLDKYNIREDAARELDRLVDVLVKYPDIDIRLESHTDSRACEDYNLELSEKRARSTFIHLVSKGIEPRRIQYVGLGKTLLVNDCEDGVSCSEEQHAENRRTVVEILKAKVTKRNKGNVFYF